MSALLKVKAIWLKEGVEEGLKEVRRFRVSDESSAGGNGSQRLPNVLHNVHSLFNVHTATQYCTLYWKDEDDDLIQFSSEEELSHAIDSMSDDTLRIYVIITGEGPSAPSYEGKCADSNHPPQDTSSFSFSSSSSSSSSFQAPPPPPPPPPPPHQGPHSHCPPPPFPGPWAHQGWKKWKPMGPGGWKGGWKGGMYFGCPWTMRHGMAGCGHKGRGFFKHGCDKKQKKWMKAKRCWMAGSPNDQKEYEELLQQVPSEFRTWVGQYLQTWYTQGPEAARAAAPEKLPQNVGEDFPQWLHSYLTPFFPHPCVWGEGQAKEGEGEMGKAPSCIPSVYFRWLSGYVRSFFQQNGHFSFSSSSDGEEDDGSWQWQFQTHGFCPRGFGWKGKHGGCKKMKGGKHKRRMSCGSDDDGSGNCGVKVPKQFRKFVRVSFKKLRKGKAENPKIKAKATRAGISAEVQEYVEQIMLEWQAKLSLRNFRAVSKEMITSDRTLPPGMPRAHFLWMLRFMLHWEERRAGKRGAAHGCPSDDSSSEDTSEEESAPEEQDCGSCPPPPPPPPFHPPFMGMMGAGPVPFPIPMPSGMEHPFPPPPPPPMYGCFPPPPPPGCFPMNPPPYMFTCQDQDTENKKAPSSEEMVDQVTEGVKKL